VKTLYKEDGRDVKTKYKALGQYEKETDSTDNVRELYYISGSDGVVAALQRMNEQDSIFYIHKDHLGSFDVITKPGGTVMERHNFDPCFVHRSVAKAEGRRRNPADWSYNNIEETNFLDRGFTGHEHGDQFGLINMLSEAKSRSLQASGNGRVYDPVMALFLSPDNFVQSPDLTQNFIRYTYCLNNPLVYSDPSGYTYKAYMNYIYDEGNYWYRGQSPGTWTDWESFHNIGGGGTGSYGSGIITTTDINSLLNSAHGGGWSTGTGTYFYASQDEAFIKSSFFIEANNLWGTTLFGDFNSAINAYDGGRLADEIRANNPEFYLASLESGEPKTISLQDLAPKQNFSGFWGGLKYFFTGGYVGGYSYNIKGEAIGLAPITGMAPTPGIKGGLGQSFFAGTKYSNKVLGQMKMGDFHAFPESVIAFEKSGVLTTIKGGDGITRQILKIPGEYGGKKGFFEFIKEADGTINHWFFRLILGQ